MKWLNAVFLCLLAIPARAEDAKAKFPNLPEAMSSFGAAISDGHLYVYGGHIGKTHSYSHDTTLGKFRRLKLDDPAAAWEELPESLHLQGLALVAYKGRILRIGGMEPRNAKDEKSDLHSTASVQSYDPAAKKWTDMKPMPAPRSSLDAVVIGDTLYVVGGWTMNGAGGKSEWQKTMLTLDLSKPDAEWKSVEQPFVRRALSIAALDGKIYVCGGLTSDGGVEHGVNVFDTKTGQWSAGPKIPGERMNAFTPSVAAAGGKVYLSPADGKIYELAEDAWKPVGHLAKARWVHRTVVLKDGRILALGGATADGYTASLEIPTIK